MPKPTNLRRINEAPARDRNPIAFMVTFGPGRWPRVPPWRPRLPSLAPPPIGLPAPPRPDTDIAHPDKRPALSPNHQAETVS